MLSWLHWQAGRDFVAKGFWGTRMVLFDSFESPTDTTSNGWTSSSAAPLASCGVQHGTKGLRFTGNSAVDRFLRSKSLAVPSGGQWQFFLKYSNEPSTGACPGVQTALVTFYYSVNNGATWEPITTFEKNNH